MKKSTKVISILSAILLSTGTVATLAGCGGTDSAPAGEASSAESAVNIADKVIKFGTADYSGMYTDNGIDPADGWASWATVRYGIGECLVEFSEDMELQSKLAKTFTQVNPTTWEFELYDNIVFSNGNQCDAAAVKASFERLMEMNESRASDIADTMIDTITADGLKLTITTTSENPILPNQLYDPMWCVIDTSVENLNGKNNLVGTGPYKLVEAGQEGVTVVANENYWNGTPKVGTIQVVSINDGDTLAMALQNGEVDIAQEMPVNALQLFKNDNYTISTKATSRSSVMSLNTAGQYFSDENVRLAVVKALDKEAFVNSSLLDGYGEVAEGFFPKDFASYGDEEVKAPSYNLDEAKQLLADSGWTDTNGDGYVDKDGKNMKINVYTYTRRPDLPRLAEAWQASLKEIGVDMEITLNDTGWAAEDFRKLGADKWDVNLWSMTTAPHGDPLYMIDSTLGKGGYYCSPTLDDPEMEAKIEELAKEADLTKRYALAVEIQDYALQKGYFAVAFHKEQSLTMIKEVTGIEQYPTDMREITVDIDISE